MEKGSHHTKEVIARISQASKRHWQDPEFRRKAKIKSGKDNHFYGKHHTEETKEKIRKKMIGRKISQVQKNKIAQSMKKQSITHQ